MALKPYLQLVRLPNLFTAAADPLTGFLIVGGALADFQQWLPLALAGVAIYAAGMVLNDVFDYRVDLLERPNRPLPAGRISRRFAAILGVVLLILGGCLAAIVSMSSLAVAVALIACVIGYDAGLKRTWLGPQVMGACRSLNLLSGMSLASALGGPSGWLAAGMFGLFVVGVTWISRNEVDSRRTITLGLGFVLQFVALLGLVGVLVALGQNVRDESIGRLSGMLVLAIVGQVVIRAGRLGWRNPTPGTLQAAVKTGIFSLIWLDVCLVASVRGPLVAMAVAVLWIPAFLLGKWLYST